VCVTSSFVERKFEKRKVNFVYYKENEESLSEKKACWLVKFG
jgi:hypothetical protein